MVDTVVGPINSGALYRAIEGSRGTLRRLRKRDLILSMDDGYIA